MLEQIYLSLILVGTTIGVVLVTLWYQARRADRINLALIRLNEQHGYDTPTFLDAIWSLLEHSGIAGLTWRLDWFGVTKEGRSGLQQGTPNQRQIAVGEMQLSITFHQRDSRGERRYFEETLIETLLLLLRTDMLIKAGTTDATLSHMAKVNLFLQHDMKNIAQFIQLMAEQLAAIPPGKEQKVLDYLCRAAPLMRQRADHVINTLIVGSHSGMPPRAISLRQSIIQLCDLYALDYELNGDAWIQSSGNAADTILDNIFKNYHDLRSRENLPALLLRIFITVRTDQVEITVEAANATPIVAPERLFEPFWSNHADGLGVGLYQAKQMLEMAGGKLWVTQQPEAPLRFHLTWPAAPEEPNAALDVN